VIPIVHFQEAIMMGKSAVVFAVIAICLLSISASAADLTLFGGVQHQGQLTFQSAPNNAVSFVDNFNPKSFGVFGLRLSHGKIIGGEHTISYAPNFIESGNRAFIYHSNLLIQGPWKVAKPYATAGIGLIHSSGDTFSSFGTAFAFNYGGGLKAMAGPVGVSFDIRGYTVPKVTFSGFGQSFTGQQHFNFLQVSAGVVFHL
jgi:hypothetical protein